MIEFTDSNESFYNTDVITLKEWRTEWKTCPIQRDHDLRATEEKHQKKFRKRHPDHLQVNGVILTRKCKDEVTGIPYPKGTKFKTNGHTRDICWANGVCEDGQPSHLKVNWRHVDSVNEVRAEFGVFDSSDDAEKSNDKIYGAYRNAFFHKGKFVSHSHLYKVGALSFAYAACVPDEWNRGDTPSTGDILLMATTLEDAIFWLQDVFNDPKFNSRKNKVRHTIAMTSAYLASYMMHKDDEVAVERLEQFIIRVSNAQVDYDETSDCCTKFINEWADPDKSTYLYGNTGVLCKGSKDMEGYNLLMIDNYIKDNRQGMATRGSEYWKNYYNTWQSKYQEKVQNPLLTSLEKTNP